MKNKKIMKVISMFALVTAFAACSNNTPKTNEESTPSNNVESTSTQEDNQQPTEESTDQNNDQDQDKDTNDMSTESSDPQASNEVVASEDDEEPMEEVKDGVYVTNLLASNNGEPIEDVDMGSIYQVSIEDDKLILKGTIDYKENEEAKSGDLTSVEGKEHTFKLADDVTFQAVGGTAPAKKFNKDEFLEYEKKVEDSGLALLIEVEDGLVKTVSISS